MRQAVARVTGGSGDEIVDLGGTMSLNVHLVEHGLVLRVHRGDVSRERVDAVRAIRRRLFDDGIGVPEPVLSHGGGVFVVRDRVCEIERHIATIVPAPTRQSYAWLFAAMGRLHASLARVEVPVPEPSVATWGPPPALARRIDVTADRVAGDRDATALVARVRSLAGILAVQWVDEARLQNHLVHGDLRLGNVSEAPSGRPVFFDFGFTAIRPRVFDLAYALSWIILAPDDSGRADEFDWSFARELVASYEEARGAPLTEEERRAFLPQLASVPLYLASIAGYTADPAARIKLERRFLDISEWALRHPSALW